MDDVVLHQAEQIASAREHFSIVPLLTEKANRLLLLFGAGVFEGSHARPPSCPDFSRASRTRSGVSGRFGTRTPIALATAFEIAAPGETVGGSPMPITPRSSYPGPDISWTTRSPTSPSPARR